MKRLLLLFFLLLHIIGYANLPMTTRKLGHEVHFKIHNLSKFSDFRFFYLKDNTYNLHFPHNYSDTVIMQRWFANVKPFSEDDEIVIPKSGNEDDVMFFGKNMISGKNTGSIKLLQNLMDWYRKPYLGNYQYINIYIDSIILTEEHPAFPYSLYYTAKPDITRKENKINIIPSSNKDRGVSSQTSLLVLLSLLGTLLLIILFFIKKQKISTLKENLYYNN